MTTPETDNNLTARRLEAALLSAGDSETAIHSCLTNKLIEFDLNGSVLDFGAGAGKLTQWIAQSNRFARVSGVDIAQYSDTNGSNRGVEWIYADLNKELPINEASYEVIVACEVIEHLENPRFTAREWYRLLKPNGTLLLSTPNNESWRSIISLILRGHYIAFNDSCYPAHITALLRMDLRRILTEAGFSDIRFSFTDKGGIPKYPTVSWQQISAGLLRGLRYSDNLICSAIKSISPPFLEFEQSGGP